MTGYYYTGDMACWKADERRGYCVFIGRADDIIKSVRDIK